MVRSLRVVVCRVERILERLEEIGQKIFNALAVKYGAVAGRSGRTTGLGEGLELLRHVERIAAELAHGLDTLAKGREDVGDLGYGKGEVADVDCGRVSSSGIWDPVRPRESTNREEWYRKR